MQTGQTEALLYAVREEKARWSFLCELAEQIQAEIRILRGEDEQEKISAMTLRATLWGRPRDGQVRESTTQRAATAPDEALLALEREMRHVQAQARLLSARVRWVELALEGLYEKERYILNAYYCENRSWNSVCLGYERQYQCPISEKQARRIRMRALERMGRILETGCEMSPTGA